MQIVHLLSVNHIVFPLCYKANNNKGLLSSSLWGGKWRRDAEWADREREVTAILIVNIIYFYWALGLWDLSIHALSENPIRWSLSVLLQWKHRAPSNLRLRLTCTHKKNGGTPWAGRNVLISIVFSAPCSYLREKRENSKDAKNSAFARCAQGFILFKE